MHILHIHLKQVIIPALITLLTIQCSKSATKIATLAKVANSVGTDTSKIARQIVLADQSVNRVAIADVDSNSIVWQWTPAASNVRAADVKWFVNMSDAKPVYNNK